MNSKRIHAPVFALGFDDVGVGQQQNRLLRAGAVIADDEVAFLGNGAADENVGVGETGGFQARGGGFGDGSGGAGGEAGLDLDEFLVDVVRELLFGVGARGLSVRRSGAEKAEQQAYESDPVFCVLHGGILAWRAPSRNFSNPVETVVVLCGLVRRDIWTKEKLQAAKPNSF